jgi:SAM-dependent methyltransferase
MKQNTPEILVPGGKKQFEQLITNTDNGFEKILVMGEALEPFARNLSLRYETPVELIVEDYNALLNAKLLLSNGKGNVIPKIMEFEKTDYKDSSFDLIYAQASFTRENRKKIIKEVKRILKPEGILSVGEIVLYKEDSPQMIYDLLDWAGLAPLTINEVEKYYSDRGFEIITGKDFPGELKNYYKKITTLFEARKDDLTDSEKSYYKKLIGRISHEANVFLKFGGEKYISFYSFLAKKK